MKKKESKWRKRSLSCVLTVVLVLTGINWMPIQVKAKSYPTIPKLNVPYYPQKEGGENGDCGISSVAMIEAFYLGYGENENDFNYLHTAVKNASGNTNDPSAAINNGKYKDISRTLDSYYSQLAAGNPVLIRRTPYNHWSVIIGYNDNGSPSELKESGFIVANTATDVSVGRDLEFNLTDWLKAPNYNGSKWVYRGQSSIQYAKVRGTGVIGGNSDGNTTGTDASSGVSFDSQSASSDITNVKIQTWVSSTGTLSQMGYYIGKSQNAMDKVIMNATSVQWTRFHLEYDINDLTPNTTYYYQFFVIRDGKEYKSEVNKINTEASPVSFDSQSATSDVTNVKIQTWVSSTGTLTQMGYYIGKSQNTMDKVVMSSESGQWTRFHMEYDITNLTSNTTYYYRFFVIRDGKEYKSEIKSIATKVDTETSKVSFDSQSATSEVTNVKIQTWVSSTGTITQMGYYIGKQQNVMDKVVMSSESGQWTRFHMEYDITNLTSNTTYYYQFFVIRDGREYKSALKSVTTSADTEAPQITDVKVVDVDATGYMISCKVTDNVGVAKVCFPTWTDANGQDDIASVWPTYTSKNGDVYSFNVKIADHNNESGNYTTHVYAYDEAGNYAFSVIGAVVPTVYEIAYNANGGSGAPINQSKIENVNTNLSSTVPTRAGYSFVEWNTKSDGTGTSYATGSIYSGNANLTLYAQWKSNIPTGYRKGDVNGDGVIDVKDKKLVLYHIRGINKLSGNGFDAGDVNGDGVVDVKDKKLILYHIRGITAIKQK